MSQNSKAKRDKRKKQQGKRPFLRLNAQQQVQNHAVLTSEDGQVVAAIGLQGREWLLAIGGQTMGNAENPVPMLAMLKHLANVQEKEGRKVSLEYSELLQKLLDTLAEESGQTADEYLDKLVAEFEGVEAAEGEEEAAAEGEVAEEAAAEATPAADSDSKPQA
ncbi:hypothetical protein I5U59_16290 [Stenotrophomonas maltophilia]|uniref:hypothetical protein n=1 Tax=Stenotrophomonas maltophilia TaxID=40324 RepID=UPI0006AA2450|nr:hypothetical protein [Stenotrophomonas maltophilia]ALA81014.1 hypothetical protein VN11_02315 [Stenotrophomonas maltophilia]MBH1478713.1 hypothetical protein [Stenotrophomonas maltophilia]MBH1504633.1 hypothetical protein [Stenotrophomonas maltophilia]MBH1785828.1 hypothetical protein [Stenotrophomonas maltophilia]HDS1678398.1 hypothetical protein [Stenotrophomonas maltophilia]